MSQLIGVPSNVLGWRVGDYRCYSFFGCTVEARCVDEDEVKLTFEFGGFYMESPYISPSYQSVEDQAQEFCAEAILLGLKKGMLSLVEVVK
jgi:hypothetical protein